MANTRKIKQPKVTKPMNAAQFSRSINSPWKSLAGEINRVSQVYYPEPDIDLPTVNYNMLAQRLKDARQRTNYRSTASAYYDKYKTGTQDPGTSMKDIVAASHAAEKMIDTMTGGIISYDTVSPRQYDRLGVDNQDAIQRVMDAQADLQMTGSKPVVQENSLLNRIFDVVSRFEYAGANNEQENKKGVDVVTGVLMGFQLGAEKLGAKTGVGTLKQDDWRTDMELLKEKKTALKNYKGSDYAESYIDPDYTLGDKGGPDKDPRLVALQTDYRELKKELSQKWGQGLNKPTDTAYEDQPEIRQARKDFEEHGFDMPGIAPLNSDERTSWWEGFSGKDKQTYTKNLIEKGYSNSEAAGIGILKAIILDPPTYVTAGTAAVPVGAAKGIIRGGRATKSLVEIKDLAKVPELLDIMGPILKGQKLKLNGRIFTVGKDGLKEFEDILVGGAKTGRSAKSAPTARQQKKIVVDINKQINDGIKARYADLEQELMGIKDAMMRASDPIVLEQRIVTLSNKATGLNMDKAVTDALEELSRRGDLLDVPQPKVKPIPENLDEGMSEAVATERQFDSVAKARQAKEYLRTQASKLTAASKAKPSKAAKKTTLNKRPAFATARKVMTYTQVSKIPASRLVEETLNLVRENMPALRKAMDDYDEYLRVNGNDPTKVLTVEDVVANPALLNSGAVAPEIRAILPIFDVSDVKNIMQDPMYIMYKQMGYSHIQATKSMQRYRSVMAEGMAKNQALFGTFDAPRLAHQTLDWTDVKAARQANAAALDGVLTEVRSQAAIVSDNISSFLAEAAVNYGQKAGTQSALELRFAGVPLVHLTTPAAVNKAFNTFLQGDNLIANSLRKNRERTLNLFKGYSGLSQELNNFRTQYIGGSEQIVQATLGYVHNLYAGVSKGRSHHIMEDWLTGSNPETLQKYGAQLAGLDETFMDLQAYAPGLLRVEKLENVTPEELASTLNRWLPSGSKTHPSAQRAVDDFRLDAKTMKKVLEETDHEFLSVDFWKAYYRKQYLSVPKNRRAVPSSAELTWQMRMSYEKAIGRSNLIATVEETFGISKTAMDNTAHKILSVGPPGEKWDKVVGFSDDVLFPPELQEDIYDLLSLVDNRVATEIASGTAARAGTFWKASVTVYNVPEYFVRNAVSDSIMMFFGGFNPKYSGTGIHVLADTGTYVKLMRDNPEFARAFVAADPMNKEALQRATSLAEHAQKGNETRTAFSFKGRMIDNEGNAITELTSTQFLNLYFRYGLETNFVRTSLGAVREMSPTISRHIGDPIKHANSYGEDARRLSMFADGLNKAEKAGIKNFDEAAAYAADHARKYLFDYSDFSNFERNVLGRLVPFYKWTRKALPLMVEMLLFKPGKVSLIPKVHEAVQVANGGQYGNDQSYPWITTADAIIPSWMRNNPGIYLGDKTDGETGDTYGTYGIVPDPFSEIWDRQLDPFIPGGETINPQATFGEKAQLYGQGALNSILTQMNPGLRGIPELASGSQAFGANETGWRPTGGMGRYFTSMFPQVKKSKEIMGLLNGSEQVNGPADIANLLGAMNVQDNDPQKQMSELIFLLNIINKAKAKAEPEYYGTDPE